MTGVQLSDRRNRARGMLLGAACGDALGARFEGHRAVVAAELLAAETASGPLTYTDDTAMMIVVTEHLLGSLHRHRDLDEAELVAAFAAAWRLEPGRGYGTAPPRIFNLVGAGVPWREAAVSVFGGRGSYGNGGAMRVAPVALVAESLSQTVELARRTASVTHTHPLGLDGAAVQACAVALALASDPRNVLDRAGFVDRLAAHTTEPELLDRLVLIRRLMWDAPPDRAARVLGNGIAAVDSVPTATLAFLRNPDDPTEAIRYAIRSGGDTDTIAAMTGAIAGARCGETALPTSWLRRLENGAHLRELADALTVAHHTG